MVFVKIVDKTKGLKLRGKLEKFVRLIEKRIEVMKSVYFSTTLKNNRNYVAISSCENWIYFNRLEAVYCM